jgi:hypothetical protein
VIVSAVAVLEAAPAAIAATPIEVNILLMDIVFPPLKENFL